VFSFSSADVLVYRLVFTVFVWVSVTATWQGEGKGKAKVVPVLLTEHHAMKAYWRSGGIAPLGL
jgi:hypothetical protein